MRTINLVRSKETVDDRREIHLSPRGLINPHNTKMERHIFLSYHPSEQKSSVET